MKVMALTGGIGSGKTTVRNLFTKAGITTLDADTIGRQLVAKNQPGLAEIVRCFGQEILLTDGELDRSQLKSRVFSDPNAKRQLEDILHPMIRAETQRQLDQLAKSGCQLAIVEIPLLAETGKPDYIDQVIVLDLPPRLQMERVMARDHCSVKIARQIIHQQASRSERLAIADYLIDTAQPLDEIKDQVQKLIARFSQTDHETDPNSN